jgi:hypothetical protein
MTETGSGAGRMRASDAEREQMAHILRTAMGEGRLDLTEGEERLAAAYGATYRDELGGLAADLPDGGRRALAQLPEARAAARRDAGRRLGGLVFIAAALAGLWALSLTTWLIIPLVFVTLGMMKHAAWRHHHHHHAHRGWRGPPWR